MPAFPGYPPTLFLFQTCWTFLMFLYKKKKKFSLFFFLSWRAVVTAKLNNPQLLTVPLIMLSHLKRDPCRPLTPLDRINAFHAAVVDLSLNFREKEFRATNE